MHLGPLDGGESEPAVTSGVKKSAAWLDSEAARSVPAAPGLRQPSEPNNRAGPLTLLASFRMFSVGRLRRTRARPDTVSTADRRRGPRAHVALPEPTFCFSRLGPCPSV